MPDGDNGITNVRTPPIDDKRHADNALHDPALPEFVKAFLLFHRLPAWETSLFKQAGINPRLYGTYKGIRVRVVMVSRMGDIGITTVDREFGYDDTCSIYDLVDYGEEMHPGDVRDKPHRVWTILTRDGRWAQVTEEGRGFVNRDGTRVHGSNRPILYHGHGPASGALHKADPYGLQGAYVATGLLTIERD